MNNKTYANYLMHGRTKGSRNGISTTKGYTAVGQKAKGKLINGKYVYDTPVAYGNNTEMIRDGKVVYENPSVPTGVASYPKKKSDWAKEAASYDNHVTTYPKQGYDALMMEKRNAWLAEKAKAQGASNNWQQQAALEQWKKQNQNAIAAKKKKAEAFDKASDAYRLGLSYPVDQMANRTRTVNEHYNKNWKNNTTINYDAPGSGSYLDAKKAKGTAYLKGRNAVNKATMNGANTNASQQAELERWKQQNRNNIAASKKAAKQQELIKKADASYAANQGKANNWQAQANTQRAMKEYMNKASDERKAESAKRSASYNKMSSTQKNAMQNDPRYSTGLGANNSAMLYSGPRGKYDYSGKSDSRAPTLITFNGSEKMNRDPYFETWAKSTNKQEVAAAQAKNKEFMNDFRKSKERNSRSDIGNALADAKEDAKNAFKALKNKFKKKKKK